MKIKRDRIVLLSGGLGGATLVESLRTRFGEKLAVIANTGDDLTIHGLRVCPDFDAVTYAAAGLFDFDRGWGRRNDSTYAFSALEAFSGKQWFTIGDADLGMHLYRSNRLRVGESSSEIASDICERLNAMVEIVPASDHPAETKILTTGGELLHFQEWYVRERSQPDVVEVVYPKSPASHSALRLLERAQVVILGPSNPLTSISPILTRQGISERVSEVPIRIGVSPTVCSKAPTGAAELRAKARARLLASHGLNDTPGDTLGIHSELLTHALIDSSDQHHLSLEKVGHLMISATDLLQPKAVAKALGLIVRTNPGSLR